MPSLHLDEIIKQLDTEVIFRGTQDEVLSVVASGLMSDVLTTEKEQIILISGLNTSQVIRTADMVDAVAVLIVNGKPIPPDTSRLARETNITLLRTRHPMFEANCLLGQLMGCDK